MNGSPAISMFVCPFPSVAKNAVSAPTGQGAALQFRLLVQKTLCVPFHVPLAADAVTVENRRNAETTDHTRRQFTRLFRIITSLLFADS
jgi:hypothetical protein